MRVYKSLRAYISLRHQLNSGTHTQYNNGPTLYNTQAKVKKKQQRTDLCVHRVALVQSQLVKTSPSLLKQVKTAYTKYDC